MSDPAALPPAHQQDIRHDWAQEAVLALFASPFLDLLYQAQTLHRRYHAPNQVQLSQLLSIKTGGCPEDCAYCPQSAKFKDSTGLQASKLMPVAEVVAQASAAKAAGATRFCLGAAWTRPKPHELEKVSAMIAGVKALGLETCVTLGMLEADQAKTLAQAGLDYYNHNIDTSPDYYREIITTREFSERLETLEHVRAAGINVCCGGIVGMGESRIDRAQMLMTLANLPTHPQSVPINRLVRVAGTPLADVEEIDALEFVRTIAIARIMMPRAVVRLSAGRETMSDTLQALCFAAGAGSIFYGDRLLTTANPEVMRDRDLMARLGLEAA
jgi:biotin synthase